MIRNHFDAYGREQEAQGHTCRRCRVTPLSLEHTYCGLCVQKFAKTWGSVLIKLDTPPAIVYERMTEWLRGEWE